MNAPTPRPRRISRNWTRPESYVERPSLFFSRAIEEPRRTPSRPRPRSPRIAGETGAAERPVRVRSAWRFLTPFLAIFMISLLWITVAEAATIPMDDAVAARETTLAAAGKEGADWQKQLSYS